MCETHGRTHLAKFHGETDLEYCVYRPAGRVNLTGIIQKVSRIRKLGLDYRVYSGSGAGIDPYVL